MTVAVAERFGEIVNGASRGIDSCGAKYPSAADTGNENWLEVFWGRPDDFAEVAVVFVAVGA